MAINLRPAVLWTAFALVAFAVVVINASFHTPSPPAMTGYVSSNATIDLCVNSPPTIDVSACSNISFVGVSYTCSVVANDSVQILFAYSVDLVSGSSVINNLLFMTQENLTFTANNSHIGNYTIRFTVDDGTDCGETSASMDFNLTINASSDAPYLVQPLPNRTWAANTLLLAFDLDNYFADPNGDPLSYQVTGNANIGVTITAGEVLLTPANNWCGNETVVFRATDPTNLSADSNSVLLTVNCPATSTSGSGQSGSSGGGGGGGAAVDRNRCVEQYSCFSWSSCQLTRAVSLVNGSSQMVEVTGVRGTQKYIIPENTSTDPNVFYQGFSYKDCVDTRSCDSARTITYIRPCDYRPSCEDGIQNQGETGVDCGGPCAACGSCTDGVQNQGETGVDCGGPWCHACNTCSDGILNGQELGRDCGGPDCVGCPTCFDNIKNQDEVEVDCGGIWCKECSERQFPISAAAIPWLTLLLLILVGLTLLLIFFAAVKRRFAALFLNFAFKHKKKDRKIILSVNLKDEILRRLAALEGVIETQPMLKSQEELARIIRDYFREALHLDFEFTYEELVEAIARGKLHPVLGAIMQQFFRRISAIEFSGVVISPIVLRALIMETRELVYQTAVLTIDDLKEREKDLTLRDIPPETPPVDRAYLLLSQIHLCLQFRKLEIAAAIYQVLLSWYNTAKPHEQRALFDDFNRVYEEYELARGVKRVKIESVPSASAAGDTVSAVKK